MSNPTMMNVRLPLLLFCCCNIVVVHSLKVRPSLAHLEGGDEKKRKEGGVFSSILYDAEDEKILEERRQRSQATASSLYDSIHSIFHKNYILRPPKDFWQGMLDAVTNINRGCWNGVCSVVDCGLDWYESLGVFGLLGGGVVGVVKGTLLATSGVAAGLYQLALGAGNTPAALSASSQGKTVFENGEWQYYSLNEEDIWIDQQLTLLSSSTGDNKRSRQLRQRSKRRVKDMDYYHLLKVSTDATPAEIKRAYYREARHTHPDKVADDEGASLKFQKLSHAYHVLSNDDLRDTYDANGKCSVEESGETSLQMDSYTFFSIMFGSYLVEPYVGELKIASIVDSFLQLTDTTKLQKGFDNSQQHDDLATSLQQKRRIVDISLHLRDRVALFVSGSQTEEEFVHSCRLEAANMARGDFGDSFLISIGRSLQTEGKKYLGKHSLSGAATTIQGKTLDLVESYQTVVALVQSVATSVGPVVEAFMADSKRRAGGSNGDDDASATTTCQNDADPQKKLETLVLMQKLEKSLPKALRLVWQLNDRDIRQVLQKATSKLLHDKASAEVRMARAKGLGLLGKVFYEMGHATKKKDRWKNTQALKKSMGNAFEAATQATTQDDDDDNDSYQEYMSMME